MLVQQKADAASGLTVGLSGLGLWMHIVNGWVAEFMPLITAFGIVSGAVMTAWYYWQSIKQKRLESELRWLELRQRETDSEQSP